MNGQPTPTAKQLEALACFNAARAAAEARHHEYAQQYPCRFDRWTEDQHIDRSLHAIVPHHFNGIGAPGCCR